MTIMTETENEISIRIARVEDAAEILAVYAPYVEETAITFECSVPTVEEFSRRVENTLGQYPWLVAEREGEILGYSYAGHFNPRAAYDWAVETAIYLRRDCRGQGLGRRLYHQLEEILQAMGIRNLNACIAYAPVEDGHLTNASVAFHQKLGYQMVGRFHQCGYKFGRWYDMVWMEKAIGGHPTPVEPVRWFPQLEGAPIFPNWK